MFTEWEKAYLKCMVSNEISRMKYSLPLMDSAKALVDKLDKLETLKRKLSEPETSLIEDIDELGELIKECERLVEKL